MRHDFYDPDIVLRNKAQSITATTTTEYNLFKTKSGTRTDYNDTLNIQVSLPDDYNPLSSLEQMEMLLRFTNKAYHGLPDFSIKKKSTLSTFEELCKGDLKCLACILCEIVLFNKLKCLPENNCLNNRYTFICKEINQEPHIIFGPFMPFIVSVLKPFENFNLEKQTLVSNKKIKKSILPSSIANFQSYSSSSSNQQPNLMSSIGSTSTSSSSLSACSSCIFLSSSSARLTTILMRMV